MLQWILERYVNDKLSTWNIYNAQLQQSKTKCGMHIMQCEL